ncbi:glycoside hydrolase family 97 protein [Sphingobacterium sp. CZ-UAM]|uniref:glycoside hydrolase family 97 protein n=1 Tax=Sphingobacterium sp. CZ-UAM TaxID=1933868 RepID=UPI001C37C739|nr:glycoside hydrolase family 97 protein [Sphingobacterium sp. CZ-UAM]
MESPNKVLSAEVYLALGNNKIHLSSVSQRLTDIKILNFDWNEDIVQGNWQLIKSDKRTVSHQWKPFFGERNAIKDNYNELELQLQSSGNHKKMQLYIRLYDEGIALRYGFDADDFAGSVINSEQTAFQFGSDATTWIAGAAQSAYTKTTLSQLKGEFERPLVVNPAPNLFMAIGEAALVDYARMKFTYQAEKQSHVIQSALSGTVDLDKAGYESPWRYVMVGKSAGKLVENNYFILNLNTPNTIKDTSWIKPGKVLREVTLTTDGGIAAVDFAARNQIAYVEFDAGWYGPEESTTSDASRVNVDPARSKGPLELQYIIDYANKKNVGILLYVNKKALEKQLDEILPIYQKWGVKGLKFGFVNVGSQQATVWLHEAVRKAAKYKLMVDVHDEYRPTGYSRTFPNLITQEGIRGDEESPSSEQSLITMFTRAIAGAGDYTNCYHAVRVNTKMGGKAAQMAKAVMLYSPWQFIYWYDRPADAPHKAGGAGGEHETLIDESENAAAFYRGLPVTWDETKVLKSDIGECGVIARRSGNRWYIAMLGAKVKQDIKIDLSFIETADRFKAQLWGQDAQGLAKNVVDLKEFRFKSKVFTTTLEPNAGAVLILDKIK